MLSCVGSVRRAHLARTALPGAPRSQASKAKLGCHYAESCVPRASSFQLPVVDQTLEFRTLFTSNSVYMAKLATASDKLKKKKLLAKPAKPASAKATSSALKGSAKTRKPAKLPQEPEKLTLEPNILVPGERPSEEEEWMLGEETGLEELQAWNEGVGESELAEMEDLEEELVDNPDIEPYLAEQRIMQKKKNSAAKKLKNKEVVMEKRRKREEFVAERYKDIYGVEVEDKDGLVGQATRQARSNPDVATGTLQQQKEAIATEVSSKRKPRNPHPQPPGGRHERVDPEMYPENVLWPDRPVNIHMEFPHSNRPNDPALEAFWLKEQGKHHVPPKSAIRAGLLTEEEAAREAREALEEQAAEQHLIDEEKQLSVRQRKRERREADWPEWTKNPIAVEDLTVHRAVHAKDSNGASTQDHLSFAQLGIHEALVKAMQVHWHITEPSEIQRLTIPHFINGTNLLIADQTGTGKTLSYLLPMMERLLQLEHKTPYYKRRGQRTRALILLPNRELVSQTRGVLDLLIHNDDRFDDWVIYSMAGGVETIKKERAALNNGVDVLISTPDRILLHAQHEHIYLDDTSIVIIDEADTLMSSGKSNEATNQFMEIMRTVISNQKATHMKHVQFVCASATVSPPLMEFLKKEFGNSMTSIVGSGVHRSARTLRQDFLFGSTGDFKRRLLFSTMKKHAGKRTIIFCNTQATVKGVRTLLEKAGYNAVAMTSDMPPKIRNKNFARFNQGEVTILVSTDLASRGLDMGATVEHVLLYDFPTNTIDYLHRIGRTARAGAAGIVSAFLGKGDQGLAATIKESLQEGKSLATIRPSRPDLKTIHMIERNIPKRLPKHLRYETAIDQEGGEL